MQHLLGITGLVVLIGLAVGAGILVALWLTLSPWFTWKQRVMARTGGAWVHLIKRLSLQNWFEANMRAETGQPLDRPYGAHRGIFNFDNLQFKPVYLSRAPLNDAPPVDAPDIDTEVILGPQALRPLRLKIPIVIGGMAYGSGYSLAAKVALAKGAALAGTAANSGNGPFLAEERLYAAKYVLQYTRGFWSKAEDILKQADMIEIALGHSARGSAPVRVNGKKITPEVAERYGTIPGLDVLMEARLPEVENMAQFKALIRRLKEVTDGVPVSVKFGASHYLEKELALFVEGGADVLAFDGTEGGTHGGMPLFMDEMGLPVLPALCRAARFIREQHLTNQVSLMIGGGLVTPGDFAKCLALGADAVLIGTITAMIQAHTQVTKAVPWEPPTGLLYNDAKEKTKYNPDLGAKHIHYFLHSCVAEMKLLARTLGKSSLRQLDCSDLMALDPLYAQIAGIEYVGGRR